METNQTMWAEVVAQGRLVMPAQAASRYGLTPGARLRLEESRNGTRLHRATAQLAKVYIEPAHHWQSRRPELDLWNEPGYAASRERVQSFVFAPCTFCGGCDMVDSNAEDCLGNVFPACGGCLWAQGLIQCP